MDEKADKLNAIIAPTTVQTSDEFIETFGNLLREIGVLEK